MFENETDDMAQAAGKHPRSQRSGGIGQSQRTGAHRPRTSLGKGAIVLTLQELEGRSIKEIAEITGWSISLVRVQAFRARKEMRAAVERFLREERL